MASSTPPVDRLTPRNLYGNDCKDGERPESTTSCFSDPQFTAARKKRSNSMTPSSPTLTPAEQAQKIEEEMRKIFNAHCVTPYESHPPHVSPAPAAMPNFSQKAPTASSLLAPKAIYVKKTEDG